LLIRLILNLPYILTDWNDTLTYLEFVGNGSSEVHETKRMIENILSKNKTGNRVAPKKAERRRREMLTWLTDVWVPQKSLLKHK
jgi:hypothetical protein